MIISILSFRILHRKITELYVFYTERDCMYLCMYVCINTLKYWFYSCDFCETLHLSASLVVLKLLKPDSNEIMTYVVHRNRRNWEKKMKKKNICRIYITMTLFHINSTYIFLFLFLSSISSISVDDVRHYFIWIWF